jgi:hypothetical protein
MRDIDEWQEMNEPEDADAWVERLKKRDTARQMNPLGWKSRFTVSAEKIEQMADAEMIIPGLIAAGLYHVIAAPANGGKTTILMHLVPQMVARGFSVTYVNADISAVHAKEAAQQAERGGFDLLLPDLADGGVSMLDLVRCLEQTAALDVALDREIWIFDTLKKMTEMISKTAAPRLYATLRRLTARGMTIIALGHTNKYKDADGKLIFEGTNDLRNDCDNLVYFVPVKNDDGSMTVSVEPDKTRAPLRKMTFEISTDRQVAVRDDYVDVAAMIREQKQLEDDQDVIETITALLRLGPTIQSRIIQYGQEHHIGKRTTNAVLNRYTGKFWRYQPQYKDNAKLFELLDTAPGKRANGKT